MAKVFVLQENASAQPAEPSTQVQRPPSWRWTLLAGAGAVVGVAILTASLWAVFKSPKEYEALPGRPLLEQSGPEFRDDQVGLRFDPPVNWSMQSRATAPPDKEGNERTLVKYKRLIAGLKPGWLRVGVASADPNKSLEDLVKARLPGAEWKLAGPPEPIMIKGVPAVRATFSGMMNPEQTAARPFRTEIVGVRRGMLVIFFSGTYEADDPKCQERIRKAVASADFTKE